MTAAVSALAAILAFALLIGGLALGQVFGRPAIKGSCGGLACVRGTRCEGCMGVEENPK